MLIEAARRAETADKEMLAAVNEGSASCAEAREALAVSKAILTVNSAFQAGAAAVIARAERHGDGGTQVLADAAGLSRRDAGGQVKTAKAVEAAPSVRDALESGRVSMANARRLAEAVEKTGAAAVGADAELLARAESMRPEQFTKHTRRWAADRQADGGEADYRRLRAKRCVRVWDSDDGTVELHGRFDPVAGRRIGNRLQAEARRLYDIDKKQARGADGGGRRGGSVPNTLDDDKQAHNGSGGGGRRSFEQCMADALDALTANSSSGRRGVGRALADITVVAHVDDATGALVAETPEGQRLPQAVLDELACHARITGVLYGSKGTPIWRGRSTRSATEAQTQLLTARHGGCFHCGANPAMCQAHHINPYSKGGPTSIDNMVLICWDCHQRIHHHHWQIHTSAHGQHTLHPPDHTCHGPARVPEQPLLFKPGTQHQPEPAPPPRHRAASRPKPQPGTDNEPTPTPRHRAASRPKPQPAPAPPPQHRAASRPKPEPGTDNAPDPDPRPGPDTQPGPPARLRHSSTDHDPGPPPPPGHRAPPAPASTDTDTPPARPAPAAALAALRRARAQRDSTPTSGAGAAGSAPPHPAPQTPPARQNQPLLPLG